MAAAHDGVSSLLLHRGLADALHAAAAGPTVTESAALLMTGVDVQVPSAHKTSKPSLRKARHIVSTKTKDGERGVRTCCR